MFRAKHRLDDFVFFGFFVSKRQRELIFCSELIGLFSVTQLVSVLIGEMVSWLAEPETDARVFDCVRLVTSSSSSCVCRCSFSDV